MSSEHRLDAALTASLLKFFLHFFLSAMASTEIYAFTAASIREAKGGRDAMVSL
jgi:hypothetical protein